MDLIIESLFLEELFFILNLVRFFLRSDLCMIIFNNFPKVFFSKCPHLGINLSDGFLNKKKMFTELLNIIVRSLKLDKTLYKDNRNFGEAAIYFAGLIMILDGIAGAVAANTVVKTAIGISGLTAILTWLIWSLFIFVIGVKLFPDKETKVPFKKILIAVGYAHSPGLI